MRVTGNAAFMAMAVLLSSAGSVLAQDIEPVGVLQTIAIDSSDPTVVYTSGNANLYRSDDQGANWTTSVIGTPVWSMAVRSADMTTSPDDGTVIFAGTTDRGVLGSFDNGQTWSGDDAFTDQVRIVALHPDGQSVFAGTETAVLVSDDLGASWQVFAEFPGPGYIYGIEFGHTNINNVYVAKFGEGVYSSIDGGSSWSLSNAGLFDTEVFDLVIDPSNPSSLFAVTRSGVFQSVDAGANWSRLMSPSRVHELAIDQSNPLRMHLVTSDTGIYRSMDGGQSWQNTTQGTQGDEVFTSIAVVPNGSGFVYAGSIAHGLYISSDNGESWTAGTQGGQPLPVTSSSLSMTITDLQNGQSVPSGGNARYRITIRNTGPDVATSVEFDPFWVQLRIVGGNDPMPFTITSSQGSCPTPRICFFGDLPVNAERTIEFSGQTEAGSLTRYRLYARASATNSSQAAQTTEISASVTVLSTDSGGGSSGPFLLITLLILLTRRALVARRPRP
jgi:photosystem II stability/assembly factor-like uncharacterized protein